MAQLYITPEYHTAIFSFLPTKTPELLEYWTCPARLVPMAWRRPHRNRMEASIKSHQDIIPSSPPSCTSCPSWPVSSSVSQLWNLMPFWQFSSECLFGNTELNTPLHLYFPVSGTGIRATVIGSWVRPGWCPTSFCHQISQQKDHTVTGRYGNLHLPM